MYEILMLILSVIIGCFLRIFHWSIWLTIGEILLIFCVFLVIGAMLRGLPQIISSEDRWPKLNAFRLRSTNLAVKQPSTGQEDFEITTIQITDQGHAARPRSTCSVEAAAIV